MRRKGRPKKQKSGKGGSRRPGRPKKVVPVVYEEEEEEDDVPPRPGVSKKAVQRKDLVIPKKEKGAVVSTVVVAEDGVSEGLHVTTSQVQALGSLVSCRECGEAVRIGVRPTTKGMISEFTVACSVCEDTKSTNTPNLVRERKRKREKKDAILQKTENINYAHVAAFLDNGLGYSGLRHYCKYFNARCLNEATFIVYARQVISDVVADTEESLQYSASIVREVFKSQLETDGLVDLTVAFTTTYHQWGSDFCLVAGAVIELTTGLVLDYDVANMYCHVCKINAKKIVTMSPAEMTEWFNRHQDTCEIREWCDELDHDAEEGVREIEPKYLECFIAKKIWARSIDKFGFRYTTLIHESDEKIQEELARSALYGDVPILIDTATSCFSRRKSEHARTSFQTKLKAKCPRERVQTKDRIMYVYAMSIPEYNRFAISSNIKLRQLIREMEGETETPDAGENDHTLQLHEIKVIKRLVANGEEEEEEEEEEEGTDERVIIMDEQETDDPAETNMEVDEEASARQAEEEERRRLEAEWDDDEEEEEEEIRGDMERHQKPIEIIHIKEEHRSNIKEEVLGLEHHIDEEEEEEVSHVIEERELEEELEEDPQQQEEEEEQEKEEKAKEQLHKAKIIKIQTSKEGSLRQVRKDTAAPQPKQDTTIEATKDQTEGKKRKAAEGEGVTQEAAKRAKLDNKTGNQRKAEAEKEKQDKTRIETAEKEKGGETEHTDKRKQAKANEADRQTKASTAEKQKETDTAEKQKEIDTAEKQKETDTAEKQKQTDTAEKQKQTDTDKQKQTQNTDKPTKADTAEKQKPADTADKQKQTDTSEKQKETDTDKQKQTQNKDKQKQTDPDKQKQTDTNKQKQTQDAGKQKQTEAKETDRSQTPTTDKPKQTDQQTKTDTKLDKQTEDNNSSKQSKEQEENVNKNNENNDKETEQREDKETEKKETEIKEKQGDTERPPTEAESATENTSTDQQTTETKSIEEESSTEPEKT